MQESVGKKGLAWYNAQIMKGIDELPQEQHKAGVVHVLLSFIVSDGIIFLFFLTSNSDKF